MLNAYKETIICQSEFPSLPTIYKKAKCQETESILMLGKRLSKTGCRHQCKLSSTYFVQSILWQSFNGNSFSQGQQHYNQMEYDQLHY
jgi:hypothetical protein